MADKSGEASVFNCFFFYYLVLLCQVFFKHCYAILSLKPYQILNRSKDNKLKIEQYNNNDYTPVSQRRQLPMIVNAQYIENNTVSF